ncbi:MAG: F0F1 ATP synthase subunit delta [Treponema sp.]|nr:F0F1 ATP synthase subunit delta [Treponema sp.]
MADAAVRYAEALLTAAKKDNALARVALDLSALAIEFAQSAAVFSSPVFPVREQLAAVNYALGDNFHPVAKRFFCVLAAARRLGEIEQIAAAFDKMACKEMGIIDFRLEIYSDVSPADGTSADVPSTNGTSEIIDKIVQAAGVKGLYDRKNFKNIRLSYKFDKSLLGGFIAECDGQSWDCSLRTRLVDMGKLIRNA